MDGGDEEFSWAHLLWQNHGIMFETFAEMPRHIQLLYIASESLENKKPSNFLRQCLSSLFKKRGEK